MEDSGTGSPMTAPHPLRVAYTPGPWVLSAGWEPNPHAVVDTQCVYGPARIGVVAHVVMAAQDGGHREERKANARLIAAGPEMHVALKEAERFLDYFANERTSFVGIGTPKSALAKVRAALSKAGV